jgi:hypothetical protein
MNLLKIIAFKGCEMLFNAAEKFIAEKRSFENGGKRRTQCENLVKILNYSMLTTGLANLRHTRLGDLDIVVIGYTDSACAFALFGLDGIEYPV